MRAHRCLVLLALVGCTGDPPPQAPWPELPPNTAAAAALIQRHTRRPVTTTVPLDARRVLEQIRQAQRRGELWSGWSSITQQLSRTLDGRSDAYLLLGTFHDAGAQLEAVRRLVGPSGVRGLSIVGLEQLPSDGQWRGVPLESQRGVSAALARYLAHGRLTDLEQVRRRHRAHDYTGWKYGYLDTVTDLVLAARATGQTLLTCDMPRALQKRLAPGAVDGLRELHCLHTLRDALAGRPRPHRVALAWGQAHLAPEGLARFLLPEVRVVAVSIFGHRPGPVGLEHALQQRLRLTDPVLVRHDRQDSHYLLLLPGPKLGMRLDRAWDAQHPPLSPELRHRLRVSADVAGELWVEGQRVALEPEVDRSLVLHPGPAVYLFQAEHMVLGALDLPRDGELELVLQTRKGTAHLVTRGDVTAR